MDVQPMNRQSQRSGKVVLRLVFVAVFLVGELVILEVVGRVVLILGFPVDGPTAVLRLSRG